MARKRALVVIAAAACLAASCSSAASTPRAGSSGQPRPSVSSAAPTLPAGTRELPAVEGARLPAGRFTKTDFDPQPTFRLGHGWRVGHDLNGFFDVQQHPNTLDVIAVQFALPRSATETAAAIRQLQRSHGLRVTDRGRTTIGGGPAHEVLIDSRNTRLRPPRYTSIFSVGAGSLYIGSGRRLLVDFVETKGTLVAVLVGGSVRNWTATMRAAQPVVRSIRFV